MVSGPYRGGSQARGNVGGGGSCGASAIVKRVANTGNIIYAGKKADNVGPQP